MQVHGECASAEKHIHRHTIYTHIYIYLGVLLTTGKFRLKSFQLSRPGVDNTHNHNNITIAQF